MGSDLRGAASPSLPYISLEQISLTPRAFLSHAPSLLNRMFLPSSDMPLSPISFPWFLASFCSVFHPFFLLIASSITNFPMARVAVINFINIPLHFLISLPIKWTSLITHVGFSPVHHFASPLIRYLPYASPIPHLYLPITLRTVGCLAPVLWSLLLILLCSLVHSQFIFLYP